MRRHGSPTACVAAAAVLCLAALCLATRLPVAGAAPANIVPDALCSNFTSCSECLAAAASCGFCRGGVDLCVSGRRSGPTAVGAQCIGAWDFDACECSQQIQVSDQGRIEGTVPAALGLEVATGAGSSNTEPLSIRATVPYLRNSVTYVISFTAWTASSSVGRPTVNENREVFAFGTAFDTWWDSAPHPGVVGALGTSVFPTYPPTPSPNAVGRPKWFIFGDVDRNGDPCDDNSEGPQVQWEGEFYLPDLLLSWASHPNDFSVVIPNNSEDSFEVSGTVYIKAVRGDIDDRSYAGVTNTDGAVFEIAKPFTVRQLACELEGNATRLDENDKCVCCLDGRYQIFDVTGEQSCTALCNPEETLWESLWTETTRIALIIVGAVIICQLVCVIIYCTRCCHRWEQENLQDSRKGTKIKHRDAKKKKDPVSLTTSSAGAATSATSGDARRQELLARSAGKVDRAKDTGHMYAKADEIRETKKRRRRLERLVTVEAEYLAPPTESSSASYTYHYSYETMSSDDGVAEGQESASWSVSPGHIVLDTSTFAAADSLERSQPTAHRRVRTRTRRSKGKPAVAALERSGRRAASTTKLSSQAGIPGRSQSSTSASASYSGSSRGGLSATATGGLAYPSYYSSSTGAASYTETAGSPKVSSSYKSSSAPELPEAVSSGYLNRTLPEGSVDRLPDRLRPNKAYIITSAGSSAASDDDAPAANVTMEATLTSLSMTEAEFTESLDSVALAALESTRKAALAKQKRPEVLGSFRAKSGRGQAPPSTRSEEAEPEDRFAVLEVM